MKALLLCICLVCFCVPTWAQSPEAMKYSPRQILLVSPQIGTEAVLPMVFTTDGKSHLEFVPVSQVKDSLTKGGQPIRLGDVLAALSDATQTINKLQTANAALQTENGKLWKLAMKENPQSQPPPTVIVQQPPETPQPSRLERYMLLRGLLPAAQPYRLPMPVNPNANRIRTNCTTNAMGNTTYTNCN